jgi:signal peptidase I
MSDKADKASAKKGGLRSWLWLALFAWALRSLIVAPFSIPSGSMLPTMWIGDYLFVTKWNYGYSKFSFLFDFPPFEGQVLSRLPARGDIVIFRPPGRDKEDWVKRVIGLPGDRIAVQGGALILDGQPVKRVPAGDVTLPVSPNSPCRTIPDGFVRPTLDGKGDATCLTPAFRETLPNGVSYLTLNDIDGSPGDDFAEVTVPAGHVFLMGDNRDDSEDSRFPEAVGGLGMVPQDRLIGKATARFWSTDGSASWFNPISWFSALRTDRIGGRYSQ